MSRALKRAIVAGALFVACAQQMPPTGGEKDIRPPMVREAAPEKGAINVDRNASIRFVFSEWIHPERARKSVAIFPTLEKGYTTEVRGRTLVITPKQKLRDSTTYHVTLSAALEDLHGNPVASPVDHVFATGPFLDSASLSGCVIPDGTPKRLPKIGLFEQPAEGDRIPDSCLLALPTYLAQADSAGTFSFTHLRAGTYAAVAFIDEDDNSRITASREAVWTPTTRSVIIDSAAGVIQLFASNADTAAARIVELRPHSSHRIHGSWSSGPLPQLPSETGAWRLESLDSLITAPRIDSMLTWADSSSFILMLREGMKNAAYRLLYPRKPRFAIVDSDSFIIDTIRFNGYAFADTIAPRQKSTPGGRNMRLHPNLHLVWSEPVKPLKVAWQSADTLGDTIRLVLSEGYSDTTRITFSRSLNPGRTYTAAIPLDNFIDLAGNAPSDTTDTGRMNLSVTTIEADSLCYLLAGGAECLEANPHRVWAFNPAGIAETAYTADTDGGFAFDSIPAAKGRISYFIDSNTDGRPTPGMLFPWRSPEPRFEFPDTVEARARWEIEGVSVPACRPCPPPHRETAPASRSQTVPYRDAAKRGQ